MIRALIAVVAVGAVAGCPPPEPKPMEVGPGCNPLGAGLDCGVPYPSDVFLVDDATTPSGKRIELAGDAALVTAKAPVASANVFDHTVADGFSRVTPIVMTFGVAVEPESLPGIFDDASLTTGDGFHTALINAATGARVAHFIDVDPLATDLARQALVMHPLVRLDEKTRYVVALTGVKTTNDEDVPVPEAFRRIRDDALAEDDALLKPLLAHFDDDVFPIVTDAGGLGRDALQLAFDFTTGSDESATSDMLNARAVALAELAAAAPVVTADASFEGDALASILGNDDAGNTFRLVRGTVTGPRVVDGNSPGAQLVRDAGGKPALNGTVTFTYTAVVSTGARDKLAADGAGVPAMMFGHGFFGDSSELEGVAARDIADHAGVVAIAIDWQGMSVDDIGFVVSAVGGEVSKSVMFGDRVMQSMVNWMAVTHAVKAGAFGALPEFQDGAGAPFIDVDKPIGFVGISLGHVLGGTMNALNPDIERTVLQVGGAAFTTMMYRARPFDRFLFLLNFTVPDALDQQKLAAQMQSPFDRFDPATYAPFVVGADVPVGPTNNFDRRRVLEMVGVGDAQVPNVASELHARIMDIPLLSPAAGRPAFDLAPAQYPHAGSGIVIYDLGVDDSFYAQARSAAEENIVHEAVRRAPQSIEQVNQFLNTGVIVDACGGACVVDPP